MYSIWHWLILAMTVLLNVAIVAYVLRKFGNRRN